MRLISFDVGIRNLAVCILNQQPKSKKVSIEYWDVIDLNPEAVCTQDGCGKPATVCHEEKGLCKAHAKSLGCPSRPAAVTRTALGKTPKASLLETMKRYGMQGVTDSTKKPILVDMFDAYLKQKYAAPLKRGHSGHLPIPMLSRALVDALNKRPQFMTVDAVIIEQQMKSRMIAMSMALCTYFQTKCPSTVRVELISPRHKLTVGGAEPKQRTYKERKTDGVALAREQLAGSPWLKTLDGHKKKDDLADCYLQAVWWLNKSG